MRLGFPLLNSAARVAFVCTIAGASAACSSDAMRFTDTPFNNPFGSSARVEPQTTASVASAPSMPVQSQALPPVSPVASAPLPAPTVSASRVAMAAPVAAGGAVASLPGAKGWTSQGGSTVTVGAGDTVKSLSNRYGVPEVAIRAANGLSGTAQPVAGTAVLIPVYNASATATPAPATASPPATRTAAVAAAPAPAAVAATAPAGSARMKLVQGAQPAAAKVSQEVQAPAVAPAKAAPKVAEAKPAPVKPVEQKVAAKPAPAQAAPAQPVAAAPVAAPPKAAPAKPVAVAKAEPAAEPVKAPAQAAAAKTVASAPAPAATVVDATEATGTIAAATKPSTEFRWPAKGRIISGFGGKGGASNDGINIALPEGTPVKAAEGGTVAYAGNELKGYGNLVLIRHPDGWVSAYAHNGEIKVKRGDTVSRGQTIATSGASGNVSSPQLHFELRKGSTPVDPMPHLSGT